MEIINGKLTFIDDNHNSVVIEKLTNNIVFVVNNDNVLNVSRDQFQVLIKHLNKLLENKYEIPVSMYLTIQDDFHKGNWSVIVTKVNMIIDDVNRSFGIISTIRECSNNITDFINLFNRYFKII